MIRIVVQAAPIVSAEEFEALEGGGAGGIATFSGLVRADDGVETLELEHYPGMTERALEVIAAAAVKRWSLTKASIVHRVGTMRPGDRIVFVGAAATHRAAALEACGYMIDRLKTNAPFWKREVRGGMATWIEARDTDEAASRRWM